MARSVEDIEKDIDALSAEDQQRVLQHLVAELDQRSQPVAPRDNIEAAWLAECERRYEELASGEVEAIPLEKVMADLRRRHGRAD